MSHISDTSIRLDDKEAVIRMCELLPEQFTFLNQKYFRSYGSSLPKCDFAIRVAGAEYDVGFERQADGTLKPLVDWWSSGGLEKALGGREMPSLKKAYNLGKAHHEATRLGYETTVAHMPDGKFKMLVTEKKNKRSFQWMRTIKEKFTGSKLIAGATGQTGLVVTCVLFVAAVATAVAMFIN